MRDILALLSEFDLEREVSDRKLNPKSVPVSQLYQILKEQSNSRVTLDEVKNLAKHVRDKSSVAQRVGSNDDIDINDLLNSIMDNDSVPKQQRY